MTKLIFQQQHSDQVDLLGIAVQHSLSEDKQFNIVDRMIELVAGKSEQDVAIYLVQIYEEDYEPGKQLITFVGAEASPVFSDRLQKLAIPAGRFIYTENVRLENIDDTYVQSYAFFAENDHTIVANFDFEKINSQYDESSLFFPLQSNEIVVNHYLDLSEFLKEYKTD
ncbi:hypothetical protein SAMN04488134_10377 [Amphibacillus marinus]|uniref:Uncharacterized protein n=1 Tax=Amphibacillus marinus TaxID=872970 RepID=A0A1H8L4B3_9BACI|nr:hypothetical protein [Amphibacillus marinus]SEN99949.1 hypothetical protein SAMN04488134_10377 [Amphibacillus marinus]